MTFMPQIQDPKELIKSSIERAKRSAKQVTEKDRTRRIRERELARVRILGDRVSSKLNNVVKSTANFNHLSPFYKELVISVIDLDEVKKSLSSLGWLSSKVAKLSQEYSRKIKRERDIGEMTRLRKQFEARVEDLLMRNMWAFNTLREASKKLEKLPKIKEMPTVILAGYPNVGKSSIMKALTGSDVEIKSYPFTTKQILVGYIKKGYKRVQIIDTPGLLDRPIEKANKIERQAISAIRNLSRKIIFILDPSETCGYSIENQLSLLKSIQQNFNVIVVSGKSDLKEPNFPVDIAVSVQDQDTIDKLRDAIFKWVNV